MCVSCWKVENATQHTHLVSFHKAKNKTQQWNDHQSDVECHSHCFFARLSPFFFPTSNTLLLFNTIFLESHILHVGIFTFYLKVASARWGEAKEETFIDFDTELLSHSLQDVLETFLKFLIYFYCCFLFSSSFASFLYQHSKLSRQHVALWIRSAQEERESGEGKNSNKLCQHYFIYSAYQNELSSDRILQTEKEACWKKREAQRVRRRLVDTSLKYFSRSSLLFTREWRQGSMEMQKKTTERKWGKKNENTEISPICKHTQTLDYFVVESARWECMRYDLNDSNVSYITCKWWYNTHYTIENTM